MTCNNCGKPIARGKWCSDKCRKAFTRTNPDKVPPKPGQKSDKTAKSDKPGQCPKCGFGNYDPTNEWSHSACFKGQAAVEAYYTEANFPSKDVHYVIGGKARKSPWKKDDPRSKAHFDQPISEARQAPADNVTDMVAQMKDAHRRDA